MNVTTLQASPANYAVEQDENGLFIGLASNRLRLDYDSLSDRRSVSAYGDYMRNH